MGILHQFVTGWLLTPTGLLAFLFYITLVVFVHEMGHYLMARAFGAKVDAFSIGFGPEVFGFNDKRGTRWKLSWIPVGGYVKFAGDADAASTPDRAAARATAEEQAQMMVFRPVHQRALVAAAGPFANFILATALFFGLALYSGHTTVTPLIGQVIKASPAEAAGFHAGDTIATIDGRAVDDFGEVQEIIRTSAGQAMTFGVHRNGQVLAIQVTPRMTMGDILGQKTSIPFVGLGLSPKASMITGRYTPLQAFGAACGRTWEVIHLSLKGVGQLITGRASLSQLQGPVGIAQITKKVAEIGFLPFLSLLAFLSVSIGLINLFPIPLLDGGHLLYYACEAVLGRPLGERVQDVGFRLGLVLVLGLMILATWNDIARLNLFWIPGLAHSGPQRASCRTDMRTNGLKRSLLRSTSAWLSLALLVAPAEAQVPAVGPAPAASPLAAAPAPVAAPAPGPQVIRHIVVTGTQRIEPATVLTYLNLQEGDPYNPGVVDDSLKALFASGLFTSSTGTSFDPVTGTLTVRVSENPVVNQVVFEGNSKISSKDLTKEIQIKPRSVFTRAKVQTDVTRLMQLYRLHGRFAAVIDPQIISRPQNRVDLIFKIDEGAATGVSRINFSGDKVYSPATLRSQIATEESVWWKVLSSNDNYDPDRLDYDKQLLSKFYDDHGYARFKVTSAVAQLQPDAKAFFINFTVDEGLKYNFGKVSIVSKIPELQESELRPLLHFKTGDVASRSLVQKALDTLTNAAATKGYAFATVVPRSTYDDVKHTVDWTFTIEQGPRVYIEHIDITGNTRTLDKVIRREFRLTEGDAFNQALVDRSQARIRSLGFFKDVSIKKTPGSQPDRTNVTVAVTEQSTGSISVGLGYSSYSSLIGDISYTEINLFGRGQQLSVIARLSQYQRQFQFSFTEPEFLDRPLTAGFDLIKLYNNYQEAAFSSDTSAATLRTGFPVTEYSSVMLDYSYKIQKLQVAANAPSEVILGAGTTFGSIIGYNYIYSDVDNARNPTSGIAMTIGQNFAGFGGSLRYIENAATFGTYTSMFDGALAASLTSSVKYITSYDGTPVPVNSRYFEGGDTFKGFAVAGVGPRDLAKGKLGAIGGDFSAIGEARLRFPSLFPESFGLKLGLFSDFGTVGHIDSITTRGCYLSGSPPAVAGQATLSQPTCIRDNLAFRASAGLSVQWTSPFGPIDVDVGVPFVKAPYDQEQIIHFSTGTGF